MGVGDFFRDDDVFIGIGNESLTTGDVQEMLDELYPDGNHAKTIMKEWEKTKKRQHQQNRCSIRKPALFSSFSTLFYVVFCCFFRLRVEEGKEGLEKSKIDSGLGSDDSARDENESETASKTSAKTSHIDVVIITELLAFVV